MISSFPAIYITFLSIQEKCK